MTREQFNRLLRNPSTIDLNFISDLEEITRRFPYFTNAQILLAKQYHGHENIKYESQLRKTSAYAPDRTILYQLIRQAPDEVIHITTPASPEKAEEIIVPVSEKSVTVSEFSAESTAVEATSDDGEITVSEDADTFISDDRDIQIGFDGAVHPVSESEISRSISPLEIIEQRLRELEAQSGLAKADEENTATVTSNPGEEHIKTADSGVSAVAGANEEPVSDNDRESQKNEPAEMKVVKPEKARSGYEAEPSVRRTPSPPASHPAKAEPEQPEETKAPKTAKDIPITHSFSDWLKIKSVPVIAAENISEFLLKEKNESVGSETTEYQPDLIEKFIKSEPRIVPGKSEFYSPGNMARKSATEHEDLISETLARIYAQQGNIPKAIDAYQRLSLKNPEKSAYFAALIKDLEGRSEG